MQTSPKRPRLSLDIGCHNVDARTMGLLPPQPHKPSPKKRGRSSGSNTLPYGMAGTGKQKGIKSAANKKKQGARKNLISQLEDAPASTLSATISRTQSLSNSDRAPELANPQENGDLESRNKRAVKVLYDAFISKDVDVVHLLLAPYLEWWFHGPRTHQHLNRLLTGAPPYDSSFKFVPLTSAAFKSMVVAEGYDEVHSVSWVHAWTVTDGIITHVREYYNTSVTITKLSSPKTTSQSGSCQSVWESKLSDNKSVPGLVLAL
ncbi:uncharacterized protein LOC126787505 [Argentina anserina]|uniref:uncharacterized protein LOC126787505 n=1 Tax=Argentina anserina TaxID=57926 RepID=UPI00217664EA|nr:uncharacterized protein LOC126787505 [Potentilla anserina]